MPFSLPWNTVSRLPRARASTCIALLACTGAAIAVRAAATEIVHIEEVEDRDVAWQAFRLKQRVRLEVRCEGAGSGEDREDLFAYGWILNAATREVVWKLTASEADKGHGDNLVVEAPVELPAGEFIAMYTTFWSERVKVLRLFGREIMTIRLHGQHDRRPKESRHWGVSISVNDADARDVEPLRQPPRFGSARNFVQIVRVGENQNHRQGFTLAEPMQVEVYCQGEFAKHDGGADSGWIIDAKTRQRVWKLERDNYQHGGGALKNKVARARITLPAGNYLATYVSDDSHSYEDWNAAPPYDPEGWGIVLSAPSAEAAARVRPYEHHEDSARDIISVIRQGDSAYETRGFTLKRPASLRIYALGEYDASSHEFVDLGWIETVDKAETVWSMTQRNTEPAGGASKNRLANAVVQLPAGSYVVHYNTDDSHSYQGWNDSPPLEPEQWGIQVSWANDKFVRDDVAPFDPEQREVGDWLARLIRVGSGKHERAQFELTQAARLHILAIGEGVEDEMYDYGWITKVQSAEVVWEMTMRSTRHAGGARKNRLFEGIVLLDRGSYEVHFVTDDSHAWGDWNQARPHEPQNWGIVVRYAEPQP